MTKVSVNKNKLSVGTNPNSNCVEFNENGSGSNIITSVFGRTGDIIAQSGDYNTSLVTEGSNLYFTQARAIASPLTGYVSGAGTIGATDTILQAIQKLNGNIGTLVTGVSSVSGTTNRITASPTTGAVVIDISSSYVGQTSITTLGTITTGTWSGTTISIAKGGTNSTSQVNNGVNYFDGTFIKSLSTFLFDGTNLGIGATPQSILTVSKQTTIQAPVSGSAVHYIGLDANPLRITYDTHNSANASGTALMFRRSRGTAGTPLSLSSGDDLGSFNVRGYGATGYAASSTGLLSFKANQTFTDTNQGTYFSIFTTPDNSVTAAEVFRFGGSGQLGIGGATYGSANALFTSGGASAAPSWTNTGTGVLTWLTTPSWTNFNSAITGTAPYWSLASGGTTTAANTITTPFPNSVSFSATWTGTAAGQSVLSVTGTLTGRTNAAGGDADDYNSFKIDQTFTLGASAANQIMRGLLIKGTFGSGSGFQEALTINPTMSSAGASSYLIRAQAAGTDKFKVNYNGDVTASGTLISLTGSAAQGVKLFTAAALVSSAGTNTDWIINNAGASGLAYRLRSTNAGVFSIDDGTNTVLSYTATNLTLTQKAQSSAWAPALTFTPGAHTALTANAEFSDYVYSAANHTWIDGTVATQRWAWMKAPSILGTTTLATATDGYTLAVDAPLAGTKGAITKPWAIWSNGNLKVSGSIGFFGTNSTGAGSALLGANSPASTLTAPYTWLTAIAADGSTVFIPCWK